MKELWNLLPKLRRVAKARCMAGESLHAGPERSFQDAAKDWIVLETLRCWGCQSHGMSVKRNHMQGREPGQVKEV